MRVKKQTPENNQLSDGLSGLRASGVSEMRLIDLTVNDLQIIIANEISKERDMPLLAPENDYITRAEAGEILRVSLPTVHKLMNASDIQHFKVGRRTLISKQSVLDFINKPVFLG